MRPIASALFLILAALPAQAQPPAPRAAAQSPYQTAIDRVGSGDLTGAIVALEAIKGDPNADPRSLSLLGGLYVEAGRAKDALAILGPLAQPGDADPAVLYNAGRAARQLGDLAAAEGYLQRSLANAPTSPAARELGLVEAQLGKTVEGYKLLRTWAVTHPEDGDVRLAAALAAFELERAFEAEHLLKGLTATDPRVRLLSGRLHLAAGDAKGALALLAPVPEDLPADLEHDYRQVLTAAEQAGQKTVGPTVAHAATDADPQAVAAAKIDFTALTLAAARRSLDKGDLSEALQTVRLEKALAPDDLRPRLVEVRTLLLMRKNDEALAVAEGLAKRLPKNADVIYQRGTAEMAARKLEAAENDYRKALELSPDHVPAMSDLAVLLISRDRKDEAAKLLERVLQLQPDNAAAAAALERLKAAAPVPKRGR